VCHVRYRLHKKKKRDHAWVNGKLTPKEIEKYCQGIEEVLPSLPSLLSGSNFPDDHGRMET